MLRDSSLLMVIEVVAVTDITGIIVITDSINYSRLCELSCIYSEG